MATGHDQFKDLTLLASVILMPLPAMISTLQICISQVSNMFNKMKFLPHLTFLAMAFTTYIFINCISAGLNGTYHPQLIGVIASKTIAFLLVELLFLKLGTYLLNAGSSLLDFVAYSGYKFIGIILTILAYAISSSAKIKWAVLFTLLPLIPFSF